MTAQHTPGPWVVTQDCGAHVIRGANIEHHLHGTYFKWRDYVASTWGGENLANARLIAAAPDLLAALLYWKNECSGNEPSISVFNQMVDAAIQKATKEQV